MTLTSRIDVPLRLGKIFAHTGIETQKLLRLNRGGITVRERHEFLKKWALKMLALVNVKSEVVGSPQNLFAPPAIFVGNHISYLDIPLLFASAPVVFVAKKELAKWPIFGTAIKSANCFFVDRGSKESRKSIGAQIAPRIKDEGQSIAIFPSGTTTVDEAKPWRWGAFEIAKEFNIPIRPFRINYEPLRLSAYIDKDMFAVHLWNLLAHGKVRATIEFHEPVTVTDPPRDAEKWQNWVREILPEAS